MRKLTVPEKISLTKEVMRGLSAKEFCYLMIALAPALVGVILFWCINSAPGPRLLALVGLLIYALICYAVFSTPDGSQSIYTYMTRWVRFLKKQKFYRYQQQKEAIYFVKEKETL